MNAKELAAIGLTKPRAQELVRCSKRPNGAWSDYYAQPNMRREVEAAGYIERVLTHTPEELAELKARHEQCRRDAAPYVGTDEWGKALALLTEARALEKTMEQTQYRLTEKGWSFVREHGDEFK